MFFPYSILVEFEDKLQQVNNITIKTQISLHIKHILPTF